MKKAKEDQVLTDLTILRQAVWRYRQHRTLDQWNVMRSRLADLVISLKRELTRVKSPTGNLSLRDFL